MKYFIYLSILFSLTAVLYSCGSSQSSTDTPLATVTSTTVPTTTTTSTTTTTTSGWTEQDMTWAGTPKPVTSTCTIITPEGTYRQYFTGTGGIWTDTSTNGLDWTAPVFTGVSSSGATNPSVICLKNGTFLMIYGVQVPLSSTERLYRATSNDGINFTFQGGPYVGGAVLTGEADDFVSVPDLIYINDTTLRMYYVYGATTSRIYSATSTDNGATWTKEGEISISGSYGGQTNDPDVVLISGTTYKLYFTTPPAGTSIGSLRLRRASSTDGRSFSLESGDIVDPSGSVTSILDPDVVPVSGTAKYRCYYGTEPAGTLHSILSP
ncbi:MAG: hypothetical protein PHG97_04145 [Candidatus Margulisbacteria bacterium]|nr:hypothetical protein [Candidatus Margulisiibacteriota bacterium]